MTYAILVDTFSTGILEYHSCLPRSTEMRFQHAMITKRTTAGQWAARYPLSDSIDPNLYFFPTRPWAGI